ncbi:hypothetical protein B1R32_11091 [Abditibacterium utsteinense]|uniref:Uncharacterized protein n=1 Tax=Abditibacterium utsteinense TaxID=1960156 RepID=A0A2S8SS53_9BACT|nr:hypothetical protein [Abditibacterium utsteinense]PQV63625.1 hypothetical protein B1R32_11091 [Abditibacterium utsteinense]
MLETLSAPAATHEIFSPEKRAEIAQCWDTNGFFVLKNALCAQEVDLLRAETARIGAGEAGSVT